MGTLRRNYLQEIVIRGGIRSVLVVRGGHTLQGGRDQRVRAHNQRRAGMDDLDIAGRIVDSVTVLVHSRHVLIVNGGGASGAVRRGRSVRLGGNGCRYQVNGSHVQRSGLGLRDGRLNDGNVLYGRRMRGNGGGNGLMGYDGFGFLRMVASIEERGWRGEIARNARIYGTLLTGERWRRVRARRHNVLRFRRRRMIRTRRDRERLIVRVQLNVRDTIVREGTQQRME